MTRIDPDRPETVRPTPSQTVGPFYGHALPFPGGGDIAPRCANAGLEQAEPVGQLQPRIAGQTRQLPVELQL